MSEIRKLQFTVTMNIMAIREEMVAELESSSTRK
jgi:hypothetical protein